MKRRTIVAILVVVTIMTLVLAACGGKGGVAKGKIKFPYTGDPIEITFAWPDHRTTNRQYDGRVNQDLEKMFGNVKIVSQYLPGSDAQTKLDLAMASGDMADLSFNGRTAQDVQNRYGTSGNLLDLSKYMDYLPNYVEQSKKYPLTFPSTTGSKSVYALQPVDYMTIVAWNLNWNYTYTKKYGIKIPTTADEAIDSLKAAKRANPKVYAPFLVWQNRLGAHAAQWFIGCGYGDFTMDNARVTYNPKTGKWYYPPFHEAAKDLVTYYNTLYKEGLTAPDFATMTWEKFASTLYNTTEGWTMFADFDMILDTQLQELYKLDPEYELWFITPLTSKWQPTPVLLPFVTEGQSGGAVVVSAKTKNPQLVCAVADYLNSDEVDTLVNWGYEGETFKKDPNAPYGGDKQFLPNVRTNANPNGEINLAAIGVYGDTLRHQYSFACGMKTGHFAQLYHDLGPIIGIQYKKDFDYAKQYPDRVLNPQPMPVTTPDEDDKITAIYTAVDTVIARNMLSFVMNKRPLSEWDKFIEEIKAAGDIQYIIDLYNNKPPRPYLASQVKK